MLLRTIEKILLGTALLTFLTVGPALADGLFESGQPYFGATLMMTMASNAGISSAPSANEAIFSAVDPELDTDTGYGLVGTLGWLFDNNWRVEAEIGHRMLRLDKVVAVFRLEADLDGSLDTTSIMINVVKDFRGKSFITPYFGLGVGGVYQKLKVGAINGLAPSFHTQDGFSLAFQALLGIILEVGEDTDLVVGYRYFGVLKPDLNALVFDRMDIHHFDIGIKFYFEDWEK